MTRVALVTGAARGIGAATVRALAAQGWAVLAVDRCADDPALPYRLGSRDELDEAVATASAAGPGTAVAHVADVRDEGQLSAAVAAAESRWGGLDAAVAVAGVIAGGVPLWEMPADQQRAVLDTGLGGVINLARAAVPALLHRPEPRSGRFLAVASAAATRGLPMLAAYCAAKAGVTGLIRAESARLYGLPGGSAFAAQQPVRRLLAPDEVAAALAWLAGEASSGITGAVVPVDGGLAL
jgi:SDR family mycofactocin-dependent oxidoreductase